MTQGFTHDEAGAAACAGDTTLLVDLDELAFTVVEMTEAGTRLVRLATADGTAAACPACGVFSTAV